MDPASRESDLPPLGQPTDAVGGGVGSGAHPWIVSLVAGMVALVLGLGLGVVVGFALDDGDGDDVPDPAVETGTAAAADDADDPVEGGSDDVVPQRCIDAVELADDGLVLLDRAVGSVSDFDPGTLDTVLESADALRPDLERAIEDCRADL